jgi:hypothetical protein
MTIAARRYATGHTQAEAALYAAERVPVGVAVDVVLAAGERLDIRLGLPTGRRPTEGLRLFVVADEDGCSVSPAAGRYLAVRLSRTEHGASDAGPLALNLPAEVALIVEAATGAVLLSEHHDEGRRVVIEAAGDNPPRPAKPQASTTLNTLSFFASNSRRP